MKYLSRILSLNWLERSNRSQTAETPSTDPRNKHPHDISVATFEDNGSLYLLCLDWSREQVQEFVSHHGFFEAWERNMEESGVVVISGKIGGEGDVQVVETSLGELLEGEDGKE